MPPFYQTMRQPYPKVMEAATTNPILGYVMGRYLAGEMSYVDALEMAVVELVKANQDIMEAALRIHRCEPLCMVQSD